jgi:fibro-slime domain-containing protein
MVAGMASTTAPATPPDDAYAQLPSTLTLTGVVRDFKELSVAGGHPDFELNPSGGGNLFNNMVQDDLDSDGKPAFRSAGYKVTRDWKDAAGRVIMSPRSYIAAKQGDVAGAQATTTGGALTSSDRFYQWFRDVPGVNLSRQLSLTLQRQPNTNTYTFDDRTDPAFSTLGGFFPINGELFGNSRGENKNFHFTFELATEFVFRRGQGQVFTFTGDDDVWVFIDNKLVIDLGGIHGAKSQSIELDRLTWLQDGLVYSLKFFFAERHRTRSNFRMDTTINLRTAELPTTSAVHD